MRKVQLRRLSVTLPRLYAAGRECLPLVTWNSERPVKRGGAREEWMVAVAGVVLLVAIGVGLLLWIAALPNLH